MQIFCLVFQENTLHPDAVCISSKQKTFVLQNKTKIHSFSARAKFCLFSVLDLEAFSAMDLNFFYSENISINHSMLFNDSRNLTFLPFYQHSLAVASVIILAYVLIFSLCMLGNILVCFIVLKNRQMRTVTNIFILNLAISDLLVGILCLPITLVDNLITGNALMFTGGGLVYRERVHLLVCACIFMRTHTANQRSRKGHVTHHAITKT